MGVKGLGLLQGRGLCGLRFDILRSVLECLQVRGVFGFERILKGYEALKVFRVLRRKLYLG